MDFELSVDSQPGIGSETSWTLENAEDDKGPCCLVATA